MNALTQILPLLTGGEISQTIDAIITPDNSDVEAAALIKLIYAIANFENSEQANLANEAIKAAYRTTEHFNRAAQSALSEFVGQSTANGRIDFKREKSGEPSLIG